MAASLAQLPAFEPARGGVPRCGYRVWKLSIVCAPRRPGMPRCLAVVDFDYWPGGAGSRCLNIRARLMADEEHGDYWIAVDGGPVPVAVSEAVRDDVIDSLVSAGVISPPVTSGPSPSETAAGSCSVDVHRKGLR